MPELEKWGVVRAGNSRKFNRRYREPLPPGKRGPECGRCLRLAHSTRRAHRHHGAESEVRHDGSPVLSRVHEGKSNENDGVCQFVMVASPSIPMYSVHPRGADLNEASRKHRGCGDSSKKKWLKKKFFDT